jgi:hypothetical protein
MLLHRVAVAASVVACAGAQRGWHLIAQDIGGMPLGVSFFEDGLTGVTATSQILPAGYETKRSSDGGVTWATVPDQDLFIFALYNGAVFGSNAVMSGMSFVQVSVDKGANFSWSVGAKAGGEIVRKITSAVGSPCGFAIVGETEDGSVNGYIASYQGGLSDTWRDVNVQWTNPEMLALDGSFLNTSYTLVGNVYITSETAPRRNVPRRRAPRTAAKAQYNTEVVVTTDAGATFTTVYTNNSVSALSIACVDPSHCCFVSEDGDYAYIHCTVDGTSYAQSLADTIEGAALVEIAVAPGTCAGGGPAYVAVGGYVTGAGQAPVFYRSCDLGTTWAKDPTPSWPVANLLVTDIDCQPATPGGTTCWVTLWDDGASTTQTAAPSFKRDARRFNPPPPSPPPLPPLRRRRR